MIYRDIFEINTKAGQFYNITKNMREIAGKSGIREGLCHIYLTATTAGILINEDDRMLLEDFRKFFSLLSPEDKMYMHPANAFSHIRASMLKQSATIPVTNGDLALGEWQSIILWEFDTMPRERKIIISISD